MNARARNRKCNTRKLQPTDKTVADNVLENNCKTCVHTATSGLARMMVTKSGTTNQLSLTDPYSY